MLLITGAHGFLGRHLAAQCAELSPALPRRDELDLLDRHAVHQYFKRHGVTRVVHAAGFVGGIGLHKEHPGRVATENLRMGLNVLEASAEVGARLVSVSTVCIYPEHAPVPTPESCMHDGYPAPDTAPYGIAKKTLHVVAEAMRREFGLRHLTIVPTNLYGPGDHYDEAKSHVVPALIRRTHESKLAGAQELVVWGDGSAVRDLLYAPDCARGLRLALESDLSGECLNLGSGVGTSVRELAETICAVVGFRGMLRWDTTKPVGAPRRLLDASRARQLLGFEPATRLEQGLQRAYEDFLQRYQ